MGSLALTTAHCSAFTANWLCVHAAACHPSAVGFKPLSCVPSLHSRPVELAEGSTYAHARCVHHRSQLASMACTLWVNHSSLLRHRRLPQGFANACPPVLRAVVGWRLGELCIAAMRWATVVTWPRLIKATQLHTLCCEGPHGPSSVCLTLG